MLCAVTLTVVVHDLQGGRDLISAGARGEGRRINHIMGYSSAFAFYLDGSGTENPANLTLKYPNQQHLPVQLEVGTHLIAASQYLSPDETTRVSHAAVANDLRGVLVKATFIPASDSDGNPPANEEVLGVAATYAFPRTGKYDTLNLFYYDSKTTVPVKLNESYESSELVLASTYYPGGNVIITPRNDIDNI